MHEMSIAQSILNIAFDELTTHKLTRLTAIHVHRGTLSNIVPESLQFCFAALVADTPHAAAQLHLHLIPLVLHCGACGQDFTPAVPEGSETLHVTKQDVFSPCAHCGEYMGHTVVQGTELHVQTIEAE